MSYFRDLDDYSDAELAKEQKRRKWYVARRRCHYCRRKQVDKPCKHSELHMRLLK